MDSTGVVIGYDPGGKGAHGLAAVLVEGGRPRSISLRTLGTTEEAVAFVEGTSDVIALGVDTLTCWSTGPAGWCPADRWLRARYRAVANSVAPPNHLSGSMVINGMAFLLTLKQKRADLFVTETHPKVLLFHLAETKYDYIGRKELMDKALARALGLPVTPANQHEWDAALSAMPRAVQPVSLEEIRTAASSDHPVFSDCEPEDWGRVDGCVRVVDYGLPFADMVEEQRALYARMADCRSSAQQL